jgi:hypothetical protein
MKANTLSRNLVAGALLLTLVLSACRSAEIDGVAGNGPVAASTATPTAPMATQMVEVTVTVDASPEPTQVVVSTIPPPPTATVTVSPPTPTAETTASATAPAPQTTATRGTPGVIVTSEPHVDVWTYGTGVSGNQIQGSVQTTVSFLNALIVDKSGRGALPYLSEWLHGEAVADPDDALVLGITTGFTGFALQWLGGSSSSQVEATLSYEDGSRAVHLIDLARSGEVWQIAGVR